VFDGFQLGEIETEETKIFFRRSGQGKPLLLLHGFPQTHVMWRAVAPLLTQNFEVVCADLRGYGRSGCPASTADHAPYSKRAMAEDMVRLMEQLGISRFSVAGHDRGGRVAYRMALDHRDRIHRLAVLDIVPTAMAWDRADAEFALAYWPWSLLAQPEPLPERVLSVAGEAIVKAALGGWGSPAATFPPEVVATYVEAIQDAAHIHAICEEYRAAATIDRDHDAADVRAGRRIACPLLALWSANGPVGTWYDRDGGPLGLWRRMSNDAQGAVLNAGHFFPEEAPHQTAQALNDFFLADRGDPRPNSAPAAMPKEAAG